MKDASSTDVAVHAGVALTSFYQCGDPVVTTAIDWGQRWFRAAEGSALFSTHRACGKDFQVQLTCDGCAFPLRGNEVLVERGT